MPLFLMDMKMTKEEKLRLRGLTIKTLLVLAVGLAYAGFVSLTGWGIPCVFHLVTGWDCPGCGISRMFLALLRGDIVLAARYNLLVLCLLPAAGVLGVYKAWQYIKTGSTEMGRGEKIGYLVAFAACVAFFVLRNIGTIAFLRMP